MRAGLLVLALATTLGAARAAAQAVPGRSADYLFASAVSDVRGMWVNPAGLAVVPEASIMGEFTMGHDPNDWRLAQYSVGLNSRGFGFSYQKDRLSGLLAGNSNTTIRIGIGIPFRRFSVGAVAAFHNAGVSNRSFDFGFRAIPMRRLNVAAVLRNVGRPRVRAANTPIQTVGSASFDLLPGTLAVMAEARGTERVVISGWDLTYHAGAQFGIGRRLPITALGMVDLSNKIHVNRVNIGISVGGLHRGVVVGSVVPNGAPDFRQLSLTAVSRRALGGGPRRGGDEP